MRILVVEDDPLLADALTRCLTQAAYAVDLARDGATANEILTSHTYDLVVLDVGLPKMDGFEVLRQLRSRRSQMPVLLLTARDTLEDRVYGLDLGADDYLTKPFDLQELVMRLRALLRRAGGRAGDLMMLGDCQVNMATGEISREGKPVEIARREWALLSALVQARGRVLSPAQLHDSLYGLDLDVGSNTVNVHVHHLRKKLGADVIDTVRGQGFRLGARYCDSTT